MESRMKLVYVTTAVAVGAGTIYVVYLWWKNRQYPTPPRKWKKVGELGDLLVYPIKSLGATPVTSLECTKLGLKFGWLRDRTLMVVDLKGRFITARQHPKMVQVVPSFSGSVLTLQAPGMMAITADLAKVTNNKTITVFVWGLESPARDCGEEVAKWLSCYILQQNSGLRLVYYPLTVPVRPLRDLQERFPLLNEVDVGVFPDHTSFSLMNEASVAELNSRLEEPVTARRFRNNFVVKGAEAYDEDNWDWVKIGNVLFRKNRPCTRCLFTTIHPETGIKSENMEPLKTLKTYRQVTDPKIRPAVGDSPVLGIHLALMGPNGHVKLGDAVYVDVNDEAPPLKSPT